MPVSGFGDNPDPVNGHPSSRRRRGNLLAECRGSLTLSMTTQQPIFDDRRELLTVGCLWQAADFRGVFDAVVCTDVLEHIPPRHVTSRQCSATCDASAVRCAISRWPCSTTVTGRRCLENHYTCRADLIGVGIFLSLNLPVVCGTPKVQRWAWRTNVET